jgi:hypothetical protein
MAVSELPHQGHRPIAQVNGDEKTSGITRRTVLAGAAAATAAATLAVVDTPARAHSLDPNSPDDMILFVLLSAALTGIYEVKLAPDFKTKKFRKADDLRLFLKQLKLSDFPELLPDLDPVNIKSEYFRWVNARHPAAFENLLRITKDNIETPPDREQAIIAKLQFDDEPKGNESRRTQSEIDAKYLARSIVLMWFLGAWYEPDELRKSSKDPNSIPNFEIISPKAYTQGWALKVAQAHPMGFSEMQFGYWTRPPGSRADFIG